MHTTQSTYINTAVYIYYRLKYIFFLYAFYFILVPHAVLAIKYFSPIIIWAVEVFREIVLQEKALCIALHTGHCDFPVCGHLPNTCNDAHELRAITSGVPDL